MSKPDGGAAFPQFYNDAIVCGDAKKFDGMTLRDYFAAAALQGIVKRRRLLAAWQDDDGDGAGTAAMVAYELADAMILEREK